MGIEIPFKDLVSLLIDVLADRTAYRDIELMILILGILVLFQGKFRHVPGIDVKLIRQIFQDPLCGRLTRLKGFVASSEGDWLEINATREKVELRPSPVGQPVIIAIGENLDESRIGSYWASYENEYRG